MPFRVPGWVCLGIWSSWYADAAAPPVKSSTLTRCIDLDGGLCCKGLCDVYDSASLTGVAVTESQDLGKSSRCIDLNGGLCCKGLCDAYEDAAEKFIRVAEVFAKSTSGESWVAESLKGHVDLGTAIDLIEGHADLVTKQSPGESTGEAKFPDAYAGGTFTKITLGDSTWAVSTQPETTRAASTQSESLVVVRTIYGLNEPEVGQETGNETHLKGPNPELAIRLDSPLRKEKTRDKTHLPNTQLINLIRIQEGTPRRASPAPQRGLYSGKSSCVGKWRCLVADIFRKAALSQFREVN